MKVLVIGAGAGWSTKDVENGVMEGLRGAGVQAARYAYDHRLMASSDYLRWVWRRAKKQDAKAPEPTPQDVQLHALQDVLPRAIAHQVDWVLVVSGMFVPSAFLDVAQHAGLPVAVLFTESPYDTAEELKWAGFADLVWTNERSSVGAFQAVQPRSFYLPHGWRATVHGPVGPDDAAVPSHDVVFVGSCFDERAELLEAINWDGIDFGLYGNWQRLSRRSKLRRYLKDSVVDNTKAAALYRRAKVGLNLYRESIGWAKGAARIAHAESLNPRAYELAACGAFHLSHSRAEVAERFGDSVPTFRTAVECEALIRHWLANDAGRASVSARLPRLVEQDTWFARGRQMAAEMEAALPAAWERIAGRVLRRQRTLMEAACA